MDLVILAIEEAIPQEGASSTHQVRAAAAEREILGTVEDGSGSDWTSAVRESARKGKNKAKIRYAWEGQQRGQLRSGDGGRSCASCALGSIKADLGREILVASKRQYRNKAVATPATIVIEGRSLDQNYGNMPTFWILGVRLIIHGFSFV
ncbi:hypothetical protein CI102_9790 [Trichoderma harzianum]|uniref:Uncharacterized protein n=1 Tax=Trichoderma harzianum CBS 226.95 TaxID=983964 RepID=A0A2T4AC26_TRIHA|nr:hypothetical protein M431DRAFT_425036 [Trichoderma harzianum CBS 226.95]PKK44976.1 hypothetical protein CI102_9790 [Trichoderma harzianum]PTB54631.1 hypothetical protein M431DRAFT_425036 [Trichoderma harzianum CBS 226.95]